VWMTPELLLSPKVVLPDSPNGYKTEGDTDEKSHCTTRHKYFSVNDGSGGDIWSLAFLSGTLVDPCFEFLKGLTCHLHRFFHYQPRVAETYKNGNRKDA